MEKADAQKRADAEKQSAAAGSLPPIEELKNLVTLKRMTKEAVRLVVNAERALAHQPAVNNVSAAYQKPSDSSRSWLYGSMLTRLPIRLWHYMEFSLNLLPHCLLCRHSPLPKSPIPSSISCPLA